MSVVQVLADSSVRILAVVLAVSVVLFVTRIRASDVLHRVSTPRKMLVTATSAAVVYLAAACQQQREPTPPVGSPPGTAIDPADVAFGYADSTGSKLLMLREMSHLHIPEARAKRMARAVCSEGREFPITYEQFQKRTAADTGRQSGDNLANDEGHLLAIGQGQAAAGDTCLLVPAGYLEAFPMSRNEFPKADREAREAEYWQRRAQASIKKLKFDPTPFQSLTAFGAQAVSRIEKEKRRPAKIYWPLHRSGGSQEVATVEFGAIGDSLLASLVLVEPTRLSYFDMPASLAKGREEKGCWRVDDDCVFDPVEFEVPAVLGQPGRRLVFFTNQGAEGQLIVLFESRDGTLAELRRGYRYQAPR